MSRLLGPTHVLSALCLATIAAHGQTGADPRDGDPVIVHAELRPEAVEALAPSGWSGGTSGTLLSTGSDPEGDNAVGIAYTPDGATLVIAHVDSRNLILKDAATGTATGAVALSGSPNSVAVSSDGLYAVTANIWEDTASIVELASQTEVAVVPVGDQPGIVVITPDGSTAVVGNAVDGDLSVIDLGSFTETDRIPGAGFLSIGSLSPESGAVSIRSSPIAAVDDDTVLHTDFYNDQLVFFDLAAGTATAVPCADAPRDLALSGDGSVAVVTHTGSQQVLSVVDTATRTVSKTIAIGLGLNGPVALRPDGSRAVCAVSNACVVVDLGTDAVSGTLDTASVNELHATADGQYALAVGFRGSLISFDFQTILAQLNNVVSASRGAVSPVAARAAMTANHFGEDLLLFDTDGVLGSLTHQGASGAEPEADRTRRVAVSADGARAVTANILSDTATILDLSDGSVEAIVDVGDRPADVAITPDGSLAVVGNLDSTFTSVIDLATHAVTNVPTGYRNGEVEISPDGQFAYTAVVASGDGVWRIDLTTLATSGGKLITGNMGTAGYLFQQPSQLRLSHDGATLVTCDSFSDTVSLVDTASWTVAHTVPVGSRPSKCLFSADDSTLFVANLLGDSLSVVDVATGTVSSTITVGDGPGDMALSDDGDTLWVINYSAQTLGVVDLVTGLQTGTVPLPSAPAGLVHDAAADRLAVATGTYSLTLGPGPLVALGAAGQYTVFEASTLTELEQLDTGLPPSFMAAGPGGSVYVPSPLGDGVSRYDPPSPWTDLGQGLAGTFGEPVLFGTGTLVGGTLNSLDVGNGLPGAPAFLVVGLTLLQAPFKFGTLVPDVDFLFSGLSTNGVGALSVPFVWPLGVPPGFPFYTQVWIQDAGGPVGFAATNGLAGTTP